MSTATATAPNGLVDEFSVDQLRVRVFATRQQMGTAAAAAIAEEIRRLIRAHGRAVGTFAAAPSQNETLSALFATPDIDWSRVTAFHLDEYVGMDDSAPQSFRRFLLARFPCSLVLQPLRGDVIDTAAECERYSALLRATPPQFELLGIGENGHLAFIDPPDCDFNDPRAVKQVTLDEVCRQQQVNDGAFATLESVPRHALSMTIPTMMAAAAVFCMVPGPRKAVAVKTSLEGPIAHSCPASILRRHANAVLFIDREAASLLERYK